MQIAPKILSIIPYPEAYHSETFHEHSSPTVRVINLVNRLTDKPSENITFSAEVIIYRLLSEWSQAQNQKGQSEKMRSSKKVTGEPMFQEQ